MTRYRVHAGRSIGPSQRWYTVTATKAMATDFIEFDMSTQVRVFATDEGDAMRKARAELKLFYLTVERS